MNNTQPELFTDSEQTPSGETARSVVMTLLARVVHRVRSERITWTRSAFGATVVLLLLGASARDADHRLVWSLVLGTWAAGLLVTRRLQKWRPNPAVLAKQIEAFDPSLKGRLLTAVDQASQREPGEIPFLEVRLWNELVARAENGSWERCVPKWRLFAAGTVQLLIQAAVVHTGIHWLLTPERIRGNGTPQASKETSIAVLEVLPGDIELEKGSRFSASARLGQACPDVYLHTRLAGSEPERIPMQQALAEPLYGASLEAVDCDLEYWVEAPTGKSRVFKIHTFEHPKLEKSAATVHYPEGAQPRERVFENARKLTVPESSGIHWTFQLNKPVRAARLIHKDGRIETLETRQDSKTLHWRIAAATTSIEASLDLEDLDGRGAKSQTVLSVQILPNEPPKIRPLLPRADARFTSLEEVDFEAEAWDEGGLKRWGVTVSMGAQPPVEIVLGQDARASQKQRMHHLESLESRKLKVGDSVTWFFWAEETVGHNKGRRAESDLFLGRIRPFEEIYRQDDSDEGEGEKGNPQLLELQKQVLAATWNLHREPAKTDDKTPGFKKNLETIRDSEKKVREMAAEDEAKETKTNRLAYYADAQKHLGRAVAELSAAADSNAPASLDGALAAERAAYDALAHLSPSNYTMKRSKGKTPSSQERTAQMNDLEFSKEEDRYEKKTQAKTAEQEKNRTDTEELLARLRALARRQEEISERVKELQAKIQTTTDEKEEAKRELKRLSDEQKSLAQELEDAQQKTASKNEALGSQQENIDAAREAAQRAASALARGALDEARAAAARSSDKVRESSNALRKQLSGQNKEDARELQETAQELLRKEREMSEAMNPSPKGAGAKLESTSTRKQLADDLNSQRQSLRQLQTQIQKVAENTETAEPVFSKALQDIHRSIIQNQTEAKLKVASDALTLAQPEIARRAEEAAAKDFEKLADDVQKAADEVFGDDAQSLRQARRALDALSRQIASAGPSGSQSEFPSGSPKDSPTGLEHKNEPRLGPVTSTTGAFHGGADGVPAQSITNWLSTLDRVEALLERPRLRAAVAQAQQAGEQLRADMRRSATKPSQKDVEDRLLSPLAQIRDAINAELARIEGKQTDTPVDRDPVPRRFEDAVRKYYETLGGGR